MAVTWVTAHKTVQRIIEQETKICGCRAAAGPGASGAELRGVADLCAKRLEDLESDIGRQASLPMAGAAGYGGRHGTSASRGRGRPASARSVLESWQAAGGVGNVEGFPAPPRRSVLARNGEQFGVRPSPRVLSRGATCSAGRFATELKTQHCTSREVAKSVTLSSPRLRRARLV